MKFSILGQLALAVATLLPASSGQDVKLSLFGASVTGTATTNTRGDAIHAFRGIRYAEPATGENRFKPTKPVKLTGDVNATALGSVCFAAGRYDSSPPFPMSEDCLFVNVYTPAGAKPGANLPVMVWTHGGGWVSGNGNQYDGSNLAGNDVVVVTFNYRLGLFGFLANQELLKEGNGANAGLRDMQLAYQWVRQYIFLFGGNPLNVTAFGESAGAFMVMLQMLTDDGRQRLFDRAVLQSGGYPSLNEVMTVAKQDAFVATVAEATGCVDDDAAKVLACLRATDTATLFAAGQPLDWKPIVDGKFLTDLPYALTAAGKVSKIPTIIGTTTDEGFIFTFGVQTDAAFEGFLANAFSLTPEEITTALKLYAAEDFASPQFRASEVFGDTTFVCPSEKLSTVLASNLVPTFRYRFNEPVNFAGIVTLPVHTGEIRFVFNDSSVPTDAGSQQLAATIQQYWANFAKYGSPNSLELETRWPLFTASRRQQIVLQKALTTEVNGANSAKHAERCKFWEAVETRAAGSSAYGPTAV